MATHHTLIPLILLAAFSHGSYALSLQQAEQIALQQDPSIELNLATADAFEHSAVASDTLPDPQLRLGLFNLPTDSFDLDQEPTTQLRFGVQQKLPRGDSLKIQSASNMIRSKGALQRAENAKLALLRDLRISFLNLYYETRAATIIDDNRALFSQLVSITEDRYASGRANQQDVLNATVQLTRLDDRYTKILTMQDKYRAQLASWIGEAAELPVDTGFPVLPEKPDTSDVNAMLTTHPAILAVQSDLEAEKKMIQMAKQDYSPDINAMFEYRKRFGENPDGSDRTDMLAAMVTMDIPLFTGNRQDRMVSASKNKADAVRYRLDDALRKLKQKFDTSLSAYTRAEQREKLYQEQLISVAQDNASAALNAYQSGVSDFTALMRAQITELDVELDDLRIRVDKAIAQAQLLYISGEQP